MSLELPVQLKINCLPYAGLSLNQLYDIMKLRQKVFIVKSEEMASPWWYKGN